ncbi:histidyl-tRNA synthetase [Ophiobolus disseminans]|uniref:histidine--tRNA ligase n=1 Tax=Ophiobolus disseminans TaxID=1469910 RepID=A0A6A6ZTF7_9PLEO|nr:histidyl-tRNA synthetase [Ophiobolus disseminans]
MPNVKVKVPKGTRDLDGDNIALREVVFTKIRNIFKLHNANEIDTPVFELKSILTDKYGEDSKLIYDLEDQGGKFAHSGKVYRRDQPAIDRGRMREFYQCDFDYAGDLDLMIPDAEVLCITAAVFEALELDVTIEINHRLVLDGIFDAVGVPKDLIRPISSAVDKLDKMSWSEVKEEMEQKGLEAEIADQIGAYVVTTGSGRGFSETLDFLRSDELLSKNGQVSKGVEEMGLLLRYLTASEITKYVSFDLSLARGLDYYTGLIYEVVPKDTSLQVGSIAAGGRYDNLVGMFSKRDIPCVGISFGVDRILTVLKARQTQPKLLSKTDVWIVAYGSTLLVEEKMSIARQLRKAGISVEFDTKADRKLQKQLDLAKSKGAALAILLEDDADAPGAVRVKILAMPETNAEKVDVVDRALLLEEVKVRLP